MSTTRDSLSPSSAAPLLTPYTDHSKYPDGTTIDWLHEQSTERHRVHLLHVRGLLAPLADASRTWFVVVATGMGIGFAGAWLDVLVRWLVSSSIDH